MGYNNLRTLGTALRDGEFGPEASIGKYHWSTWHKKFTELAMDILDTDGWLGTEWGDGPDGDAETLRRAFVRAGQSPSTPGPARSSATSSANGCWACRASRARRGGPMSAARAPARDPGPGPERIRGSTGGTDAR